MKALEGTRALWFCAALFLQKENPGQLLYNILNHPPWAKFQTFAAFPFYVFLLCGLGSSLVCLLLKALGKIFPASFIQIFDLFLQPGY
jgi:hypothetical protein